MSTDKSELSREHVSSTYIRTLFSESLSRVYKSEVGLYQDLVDVVNQVNTSMLEHDPGLKQDLQRKNDLNRLDLERHGAIRLGTPEELRMMSRFLRTMGMISVGYYDLTQAGLPIHATCFRTTDPGQLAENPLRLFVSLLRIDHIDPALQSLVQIILQARQIFTPRVHALVSQHETHGGLTHSEATELIAQGIQTFRWQNHTTVPEGVYNTLLRENPILADIVAFKGPHINHLTPRALNIDAVQKRMREVGLPAKGVIEGPPAGRKVEVLLRQTSYFAQREEIIFSSSLPSEGMEMAKVENEKERRQGYHTARFGEIEQRGAALTPAGRALYDEVLASAMRLGLTAENADEEAYATFFSSAFPDDWEELRRQKLVWVRYRISDTSSSSSPSTCSPSSLGEPREKLIEELMKGGVVKCDPIVYEDFLPISAAGIFQSNLRRDSGFADGNSATEGEVEVAGHKAQQSPAMATGDVRQGKGRSSFEDALGGRVVDEMELYRTIQEDSLDAVWKSLVNMGVPTSC